MGVFIVNIIKYLSHISLENKWFFWRHFLLSNASSFFSLIFLKKKFLSRVRSITATAGTSFVSLDYPNIPHLKEMGERIGPKINYPRKLPHQMRE